MQETVELFMSGYGFLRNDDMSLVIGGEAPTLGGTLDLMIYNDQEILLDNVDLYIRGDGISDGYIPLDAAMNLFIARNPFESMTLVIGVPGNEVTDDMNLVLLAGQSESDQLNLVLDAVGYVTDNVSLTIRGF